MAKTTTVKSTKRPKSESKWVAASTWNEVLRGDGFYISYSKYRAEETALAVRRGVFDSTFLILNGDFRKEYEAAIEKGWQACLAVYEKHKGECSREWTVDNGGPEVASHD